jgi:hypothetical protein
MTVFTPPPNTPLIVITSRSTPVSASPDAPLLILLVDCCRAQAEHFRVCDAIWRANSRSLFGSDVQSDDQRHRHRDLSPRAAVASKARSNALVATEGADLKGNVTAQHRAGGYRSGARCWCSPGPALQRLVERLIHSRPARTLEFRPLWAPNLLRWKSATPGKLICGDLAALGDVTACVVVLADSPSSAPSGHPASLYVPSVVVSVTSSAVCCRGLTAVPLAALASDHTPGQ